MSLIPQPQQNSVDVNKMKESPHIWGDSDFLETEDIDFDESKIFWMGTNANLSETPQEQLENKLAIQDQVKKGIIDEFGLPIGFTYDELGIPKDKQEEIKAAKAARQQQQMAAVLQHTPVKTVNRPYTNTPPVKKEYRSKYERKADREKMREEAKRQEKIDKANRLIHHHQKRNP